MRNFLVIGQQLAIWSVAWVACLGCNGPASQTEGPAAELDYPIKVTATVGMVADIVRQVGGEQVAVTQICGPGVDPHLYKVTRDDAQTLSNADMIFYSGLMLEGKMSDTLVKMARRRPVIAVTEAIDESVLLEPEEMQGHYDPHVWMDVSAWAQCVTAVADALAEFDPAHAAEYEQRAAEYRTQLQALHQYGQEAISTIPADSRVLVTSHDAFNYMGRAYGLDVQGVQGLSTESEAGLQRVNELVDMLVKQDVHAVFIESSVPRKSIDALVEGAQAQGHQVTIGGELYSDAMGKAGTYEGTYIGMLDHNITTVTRALGGQAPAGGLNGKLSP
ncbi:metal ABC transporter solute-binding protein, Zn/Mn family [Roseimaritima ulvae]|nr:zinc ABC transporter substrate-binding protein [Roseimaritima ulvae]